jgi:hypothetical protein
MEKNNDRFQEQEAPRKNTDNAFVKVGEDGKPEMPAAENEQQVGAKKEEKEKES